MSDAVLIDAVGRRRSKVTLPGYLAGRAPHNKGMSYPADPPRVEEIIAVMRQAGQDRHGLRIRDGLSTSNAGSSTASNFRSGRCSASSTGRHVVARGPRPPSVESSERLPRRPACAAGSRRISCGTRTRSSSLERGCTSTSSSANSDIPISGLSASVILVGYDWSRGR